MIVPRRLRADWQQEWEAELRSRERLLTDWDKLNWKTKLDLLRRSLGAFRDAMLLQPRRLEDEMFQDLRYGIRMLAKNPGFTAVAVITLALGIGANTAIFSIVKSVLIQPLPFAQPDRLMQANYRPGPGNPPDDTLSWIARRDLVDWRARSRSFERIGGYWNASLVLPTDGSPEFVRGVSVTYDLLPTLGVQPALGRYFLPEEGKPSGDRLVILSDELWRNRFGADPGIIGQTIRAVDGVYVVVGVMPPGFNFPLRQAREVLRFPSGQMGFWTLADDDLSSGGRDRRYNAILRLKPGVGAEQAQAELETLFAQRVQDNPQEHDRNFTVGVRLVSLKDQTVGEAGAVLPILLGVIGMVVLMVCANIANLLLARADGRRKEMAIRQSLGATRLRLMRQALTESLLLALAGGTAGTMLAVWLIRLFLKLSPHYIPRVSESRIDIGTLLFTLAVTMIAGLLFGALPAWRSARVDLNETLKQTAVRAGSWRRRFSAPGNLLVTFEIALAVTLTLGAGLLLNSFARLMRVDPGLRANGVTAAVIPAGAAVLRKVIERLEATPGVEAAASSNGLPLTTHGHGDYLMIEGRPRTAPNDPSAFTRTHFVSSNYLRALGVHLLRGRFLTTDETATSIPVAVISETAAQRFWNGEDPIGKRFSFSFGKPEGQGIWRQVVGIVKSTHHTGLDKEPRAEVYVPIEQQSWSQDMLFVRSSLPKADVARAIRQAVAAVDKNQATYLITSMDDLLSDSVSTRRFTMLLLGGFSALALMLAMMGVYGVVSYTVAERTPEIGVRIALGAQGSDVLRMILAQGLKPVVIGSAAGLIASMALGRVLSSLLYGVTATDPATFILVTLLLSFAALMACWLPARRATKVDPMVALRRE